MKKLLITGASGFLGSKIAEVYKDRYFILTPSHTEVDITNEISVQHYFFKHRPDIVVHCAAISDTGTCQRELELSHRVNVIGSVNIVKAAKLLSAKCIMCSSDQVYCGSQKNTANTEKDILVPHNVYGKDKALTEYTCLQIYPQSVHLRLAWMYDPKADFSSSRGDFLKQIKTCIQTSHDISLPINDMRGITDVWEVVANIEKTFSIPGGIYNFGSPNNLSTYHTVQSIFQALQLDTTLIQPITYEKSRNLSMTQDKINQFAIIFSSTKDAMIRHLQNIVNI